MKKYIFIVLIPFFFFSCKEQKEESSPDVLSPQKMVDVFIDMYTLEGKISHGTLIAGDDYKKGIKQYEEIFEKHKTNKKQVENSIDYYVHRPEMMKKIQAQVLDSLNVRSR